MTTDTTKSAPSGVAKLTLPTLTAIVAGAVIGAVGVWTGRITL